MNLKERYGDKALIAGASEGIGAAFAEYLAAEGFSLFLVARRKEPLQKLAGMLTENYGVPVRHILCDLSGENAAGQIISSMDGDEPDIMVYNAALSHIGPFADHPVEGHCQAARVNMTTPLKLVHHFGRKMLERKRGAIVLMSSLAGFQGSGFLASYAAGKAFNRILAESLWYEWKDNGVDIMACCAGATSTPGYVSSAPARVSPFAPRVQQPREVVRECFRELGRKPSSITGRGNRIASFFMQRIFTRKMAARIMGDNIRKMYRLG
ncbi:MAG: SDR family NAD(P)-dependent oxidoreductase [Bacteroidales bacterium]|nr:SDR family NAD(P)-dependent oxidoreductase [Bacteroidales bacterium]